MFVPCLLPALLWLTVVCSGVHADPGEEPPEASHSAAEALEPQGKRQSEKKAEKPTGEKDEARAALREKMQQLAAAILEHEIRMAKLKALSEVYDARGNDARVAEVIELERRENERFEAQVLVFRAELPKEVLAHVDTTLRDPAGASKPAARQDNGGGAKRRTGKARAAAANSKKGPARAVPASSKKKSAGKGKAGPKAKSAAKPRGGAKAAAAKKAQAPRSKKKGRAAPRPLSQERIRQVLTRAGRSRFLLGTRQPTLGKRDR